MPINNYLLIDNDIELSSGNRSRFAVTFMIQILGARKRLGRFRDGEAASVGEEKPLSRCNAHWPPAESRQADRFAGFSRLLRNHQSYSAIRSDNVAPRDTARVRRDRSLPFLSLRSSLAFPLIDISDQLHTRSYERNLLEWYRIIALPYLPSRCIAFVFLLDHFYKEVGKRR